MQLPQAVDRYFTEQVVGQPFTVAMGPTASARSLPTRGVLIEWLGGAASLTATASHSLWASDPSAPLIGTPVNLQALLARRRAVLVLAWLAWTAVVAAIMAWWRP